MKQFFQAIRGILLAFVVFEVLIWVGSAFTPLGDLLGAHPMICAAVILLLCLYLLLIRKGGRAAGLLDRKEYLVTMKPGAYGRIGGVFDREKYENIQRLPGGYLAGVNTYQTDDGSLLFTVRNRPQLRGIAWRVAASVVIVIALLGPVRALSWVNALNAGVGSLLYSAGLADDPQEAAYLNVPEVDLPMLSATEGAEDAQTEETDTTDSEESTLANDNTDDETTHTDGHSTGDAADGDSGGTSSSFRSVIGTLFPSFSTEDDSTAGNSDTTDAADSTAGNADTADSADSTDDSESDSLLSTVGDWISGAGEWVGGLFSSDDSGDYILPSDSRELTESDVEGMDASDIQRAINEMYARHGYDLSNSADADYFAQQDWYHPDSSVTSSEARAQFSDIEESNLNFLIACRDRLKEG